MTIYINNSFTTLLHISCPFVIMCVCRLAHLFYVEHSGDIGIYMNFDFLECTTRRWLSTVWSCNAYNDLVNTERTNLAWNYKFADMWLVHYALGIGIPVIFHWVWVFWLLLLVLRCYSPNIEAQTRSYKDLLGMIRTFSSPLYDYVVGM